MATIEGEEIKRREREEAERRNPLLKLSLGELVRESQRISIQDPNVLNSKNEVPEESKEKYLEYISIIDEIDMREKNYCSYRYSPRLD